MELTVCSPLGTVLKVKIKKVTFETLNGYYTLKPKHVDFVSAMSANIVTYTTEENKDKYVACHQGIVVKKGATVTMSVQKAVMGDTLDDLEVIMEKEFKETNEQRKQLNIAMARLEMGLMRGFNQLNEVTKNGGL